MLTAARPYVLRGRVEEDFGAVALTVETVEFLDRMPSPERCRGRQEDSGTSARGAGMSATHS
jgi:hypothetical protein